LSYFVN